MAEENIHRKEQSSKSSAKEKNTGMAIVAYIIFFIPLLTEAKTTHLLNFMFNKD